MQSGIIPVDLTNPPLFKFITEIDDGHLFIDLHNDFACTAVDLTNESRDLQITLVSSKAANPYDKVVLVCLNIEIHEMSFYLQQNFTERLILDTFYRGRFEFDGDLFEFSKSDKGYYYVSFDEGYLIQFFATSVKAYIYKK